MMHESEHFVAVSSAASFFIRPGSQREKGKPLGFQISISRETQEMSSGGIRRKLLNYRLILDDGRRLGLFSSYPQRESHIPSLSG